MGPSGWAQTTGARPLSIDVVGTLPAAVCAGKGTSETCRYLHAAAYRAGSAAGLLLPCPWQRLAWRCGGRGAQPM